MKSVLEDNIEYAEKELEKIATTEDLHKNRLTLADYRSAEAIVIAAKRRGVVQPLAITENVANWFRRKGFEVQNPRGIQINYTIDLNKRNKTKERPGEENER